MSNVTQLRPEGGDIPAGQLSLIQRTLARDCNKDEFDYFIAVCRRTGLDPIKRQIRPMVFNKNKPDKRQLSIIVEIGGLRSIARRQGDYRPAEDDAQFERDETLISAINPLGIVRAKVRLWQRHGAEWFPVAGSAKWEEFAPCEEEWGEGPDGKRRPTGKKSLAPKWAQMPELMLAKCAEAQALRKGWPEDLSGVYVEEEMHKAQVLDLASERVDEHNEQVRQQRIGGPSATFVFEAGGVLEAIARGQIFDRINAWMETVDGQAVKSFRERNAEPLKQFWAWEPGDALELKKRMEQKIAAIPAAKSAEADTPAASQSASAASQQETDAPAIGNPAPVAAADTPQQSAVRGGAPIEDKAAKEFFAKLADRLTKISSPTTLVNFQKNTIHMHDFWINATKAEQERADKMISDRAAELLGARS